MTLFTALALGAIIGLLLGTFGGGGSILAVPALVYLLGEPVRAATTGSLVIVGVTALTATITHARAGRVRWAAGLAFGAVGVAASYAGTAVNHAVNPHALLLGFAGLMLAAAVAMLARQRGSAGAAAPPTVVAARTTRGGTAVVDAPTLALRAGDGHPAGRLRTGRLIAAGISVGFLTGLLGAGGGFIIVPALVMLLGYDMPVAVGTSLLVIALNSAAALAARAGDTTFHWPVIVPFTLAAVAGSVAGRHLTGRIRPYRLTRAFVALLFVIAMYTAITSVSALIG